MKSLYIVIIKTEHFISGGLYLWMFM